MARRRSKARRRGGGGAGTWWATGILGLAGVLVLVFVGSALFRFARVQRLGRPSFRPAAETRGKPAPSRERAGIGVEVWNGSGVSGAGQRVADALKDGGFHVTEIRNADRTDYGTTLVVDRKGNPEAVREVIEYIHGGYPLVMRAPDAGAQVRVVVGRDYGGLRIEP